MSYYSLTLFSSPLINLFIFDLCSHIMYTAVNAQKIENATCLSNIYIIKGDNAKAIIEPKDTYLDK